MSNEKTSSSMFKISLRENGIHSLWRGIESFDEYDNSQDKMLLKDAIMFLHHGVELLMKEVLVSHSPFLIFEDLRVASKKQKQADKQGVGVFFLEHPPRTVTFDEAINRVDAFVGSPELTSELVSALGELNRLRNQLEHYAIEADVEHITQLLANLRNPLIEYFETQIGGIKRVQTPRVIRAWDRVEQTAKFYSELEKEVYELVKQFRGQVVPGRLLNFDGKFSLPSFDEVIPNALIEPDAGFKYEIDVLGKGKDFSWVIEVKGVKRVSVAILDQLAYRGQILNSTLWLVSFSELPMAVRERAKKRNILITGATEWQELKKLVLSK